MDYEKKYKEALGWMQSVYPTMTGSVKEDAEHYFPELRESEDERIRKELLNAFQESEDSLYMVLTPQRRKSFIAWLEKQGEQKPADKVESKFKVGDWVVTSYGKVNQVIAVDEDCDGFTLDDDTYFSGSWKDSYHLWTIEDAKDGDVLASNHNIFIFSQEYIAGKPEAHCGIMNGLFIVKPEGCWTNEKCYPATKEQQDILYQKMNEEGYEWLADKKELKMIEQKPAESRQKTKPNGGIVYEDFNEGDGYYKVNLAYLSKSQVELIENLVASWQNPTNNTVEWSEEDEKNLAQCIEAIDACYKWDSMIDWLKSLRSRSRWKPSEEQMDALRYVTNFDYGGYKAALVSLYEQLKKLKA